MGSSFFDFISTHAPQIAKQTMTHVELVLISIFLAIIVGIPIGLALSGKKKLAAVVLGFTGVLQTIPSIALLGLMIPIWGIGLHTAVAALFLYALLPIMRNTITGMDQVDPNMKEAAIAMGLRPLQLLLKIEIPLSLPVIFSGIRTAAVINVGVATLAAYIAAGGLGEYIFGGIALNNTDMILAGAIPAAVLAIVFDTGLAMLQKVPVKILLRFLLCLLFIGAILLLWNYTGTTRKHMLAGLAHEFAGREDGYPGLQKKYGLTLNTVLIDQSLMYKALRDGSVDIISGYSTDGRIKSYNLRVLKDDKKAFPPYQAALLARDQILIRYPALIDILKLLNGAINDSTMTDLNYQAEILQKTPQQIAFDFIKRNKLLGTNKEKRNGKVTIGSKIFTEQYILAEIVALLIQSHTTLEVEMKSGLGGTKICFTSLHQGNIDMYPEYTGTGLLVILPTDKKKMAQLNNNPQAVLEFLDSTFQKKYQMQWLVTFGFNNSYALMMRDEVAQRSGITKISELIGR